VCFVFSPIPCHAFSTHNSSLRFLCRRIRDTLISFIRAAFHDQVGTPYIVALLPEVLAARDDSDKVQLLSSDILFCFDAAALL